MAGPLTVTLTPGSTAVVLSVTWPSIAPIVALTVCAAAAPGVKQATRITAPRRLPISPPRASASDANLQQDVLFYRTFSRFGCVDSTILTAGCGGVVGCNRASRVD